MKSRQENAEEIWLLNLSDARCVIRYFSYMMCAFLDNFQLRTS